MEVINGKIINIIEGYVYSTIVTSGINKKNQKKYNDSNYYKGSNGTYASNNKAIPSRTRYVEMIIKTDVKTLTFDITDELKHINNWERITDKRLNIIRDKLVNKDIKIFKKQSIYHYNADILNMK